MEGRTVTVDRGVFAIVLWRAENGAPQSNDSLSGRFIKRPLSVNAVNGRQLFFFIVQCLPDEVRSIEPECSITDGGMSDTDDPLRIKRRKMNCADNNIALPSAMQDALNFFVVVAK